MSAWQPIESVPRDGTKVDLWIKWWEPDEDEFSGGRSTDCWWQKVAEVWRCEHVMWVGRPTHWMPIPEPPG